MKEIAANMLKLSHLLIANNDGNDKGRMRLNAMSARICNNSLHCSKEDIYHWFCHLPALVVDRSLSEIISQKAQQSKFDFFEMK